MLIPTIIICIAVLLVIVAILDDYYIKTIHTITIRGYNIKICKYIKRD